MKPYSIVLAALIATSAFAQKPPTLSEAVLGKIARIKIEQQQLNDSYSSTLNEEQRDALKKQPDLQTEWSNSLSARQKELQKQLGPLENEWQSLLKPEQTKILQRIQENNSKINTPNDKQKDLLAKISDKQKELQKVQATALQDSGIDPKTHKLNPDGITVSENK